MISIYALINPIDNSVFYIGATMYQNKRINEHCSNLYSTFKGEIIFEILKRKMRPELIVLETVEYEMVAFYEDFYVDLFRFYGFELKQTKSNYKGKMLSTYQRKILTQSPPK